MSFEPDLTLQVLAHKYERVILPGSKGLNIKRNNEEFEVDAVLFNPSFGSLCYRGTHTSIPDEKGKITIPIKALIEIPGESKIGFYNYDTEEIETEPHLM